jgi:hypothetical protein
VLSQQPFEVQRLHRRLDTPEHAAWVPWIETVAALAGRYCAEIEDDPFAYNETTSVGFLSGAAISAGFHSLVEFCAAKRLRTDRRRSVRGRFDLWLGSPDQDWAIEAKQLTPRRYLNDRQLETALSSAVECARDLPMTAARSRFGLLVVSLFYYPNGTTEILSSFGHRCHCAWRLGSNNDDAADTYLFFDRV